MSFHLLCQVQTFVHRIDQITGFLIISYISNKLMLMTGYLPVGLTTMNKSSNTTQYNITLKIIQVQVLNKAYALNETCCCCHNRHHARSRASCVCVCDSVFITLNTERLLYSNFHNQICVLIFFVHFFSRKNAYFFYISKNDRVTYQTPLRLLIVSHLRRCSLCHKYIKNDDKSIIICMIRYSYVEILLQSFFVCEISQCTQHQLQLCQLRVQIQTHNSFVKMGKIHNRRYDGFGM